MCNDRQHKVENTSQITFTVNNYKSKHKFSTCCSRYLFITNIDKWLQVM